MQHAMKSGYNKAGEIRKQMIRDAGVNPDEKGVQNNPKAMAKMAGHFMGGAVAKLVKKAIKPKKGRSY